ncbi:MAG TPA: DUF58 domain-containing protein [Vicinamibacterales bacterium]
MSRFLPDLTGAARSFKGGGAHHEDAAPLISLSDVTEIELLILRRMRDVTIGDHRSLSHGSGYDFVGLRDWQAGDRFSTIDWPQSTLTNFSPLIVREFEQPSTASVIVVADASLSTRCGVNGVPIAAAIARVIATIGMSAVFFQDLFGLMTIDPALQQLSAARPRIGKKQVIHCLDAYQYGRGLQEVRQSGSLSTTLASFIRKTALVPFVSDFLVDDPRRVLGELSLLSSTHDVFVVLIDAAFAFELPAVSAGWIEAFDVETGRSRLMSRHALARMADRVRRWQDEVAAMAKDADLDVVRIGSDALAGDLALAEFVAERRLRKVS